MFGNHLGGGGAAMPLPLIYLEVVAPYLSLDAPDGELNCILQDRDKLSNVVRRERKFKNTS